jgi:hypothetical protein
MVVLIGSIRADRLLDQPETEIEVDRYGIAEATEVFQCQWKDAMRLSAAVKKHPDFTWLEKTKSKIKREEGDLARVTITFEGTEGGGTSTAEPAAIYELESCATQEPIETHPRYNIVSDDERRKIEEALKSRKAPVGLGTRAAELYGKKLKGVTSYLSPSVTWTQTITRGASQLSGENLNKVGDIDAPSGPAPAIASGRNWLRGATTQTIRGSAVQIRHSWRLSGRAGWDPQLYAST